MTPTEKELRAPPCQCSFLHPGYCNETCPNDREHDPWCSQAGRPVDRSRREANDRIAVALGKNPGVGEPFITDAIVRKLAESEWVYDYVCCYHCGAQVSYDDESNITGVKDGHTDDCLYALALAYVEANPA